MYVKWTLLANITAVLTGYLFLFSGELRSGMMKKFVGH